MEKEQNNKLKRWNVPQEMLGKSLKATDDGLGSDDERERSVAVRTVLLMNDGDRKLAEFEDKKERLDAGKPTDIVGSLDQFEATVAEDERILNEAGYGERPEEEEGTD